MKPQAYSIASPPNTSGIYALTNIKTGQVYVGQTVNFRRRRQEWQGVLTNRVGHASIDFMAKVQDTEPSHWQFRIMCEAPAAQLNNLEKQLIERVRARIGSRCLNSVCPDKKQPMPSDLAKSKIIGPAGPMTYREAADFHGRPLEWATKRLGKLRKRGITSLRVEELIYVPSVTPP